MSLLDPRLWLAFALWTALVAGGAYWKGNASGRNAVLVDQLTASNKALIDRNKENEDENERLNTAAKKASQDHATELKNVRATAAANAGKRVPISADFCQPAGQAESTAPGSDGQGTAASAFLPDQFASDLREAAARADEITADMRTLVRRADEAGCFQ